MHRPLVHSPSWAARSRLAAVACCLACAVAAPVGAQAPSPTPGVQDGSTPSPSPDLPADGTTDPTDSSPPPLGPDATRAERFVEELQHPLPPGQPVLRVSPELARGSYVAKVLESAVVRDRPGGSRAIWTAGPTTLHTGNATRLMVLGARFDQAGRAWLRVQLPIRPNERAGWIRADETRIESSDVFIRIRLEARTVSVYRKGRLWSRSRAVIGAPKTPTPRGLFAIYETASQGSPDGFLGSWAMHLTAFSEVLDNYGGGPGRAAIHGRGPESIEEAALGEAKSHGCLRVPNGFVEWLRTRAPAGTPVQITLR